MSVKLVVAPPQPRTRSHLVLSCSSEAFRGVAQDAPSFCCGNCEEVLIEGVHARQFLDAYRRMESPWAEINPVIFATGDHLISKPILLPTEETTIASTNGPLVITCGRCGSANEMVTPNQVSE